MHKYCRRCCSIIRKAETDPAWVAQSRLSWARAQNRGIRRPLPRDGSCYWWKVRRDGTLIEKGKLRPHEWTFSTCPCRGWPDFFFSVDRLSRIREVGGTHELVAEFSHAYCETRSSAGYMTAKLDRKWLPNRSGPRPLKIQKRDRRNLARPSLTVEASCFFPSLI